MSTALSGETLSSSRVATIPDMPGMLMSITTTSGRSCSAFATASAPPRASATTFIPGSLSSSRRRPERNSS